MTLLPLWTATFLYPSAFTSSCLGYKVAQGIVCQRRQGQGEGGTFLARILKARTEFVPMYTAWCVWAHGFFRDSSIWHHMSHGLTCLAKQCGMLHRDPFSLQPILIGISGVCWNALRKQCMWSAVVLQSGGNIRTRTVVCSAEGKWTT